MKRYQSVSRILCPLAAIVTVASLATPGLSQGQERRADSEPSRSEATLFEGVQSEPLEPSREVQDAILAVPLEAEATDENAEELPADDPWVTFCLLTAEPGEDFGNCLDGLP